MNICWVEECRECISIALKSKLQIKATGGAGITGVYLPLHSLSSA